jgi:hypothetical protein
MTPATTSASQREPVLERPDLAAMRGFCFGVWPEAIMSIFGSLGIDSVQLGGHVDFRGEMFTEAQIISRILDFTGYTVDDVINDPIARNAVRGYYGLYRFVERRCEELASSTKHSK